ncbi:MAG: tRNA (N6-isopentenyl adenosine(37)-C2)-methylthiotransferase MiaB [Bdellovibrionales bacterium]|nr:tRNA (N6-isopentenyl adenosine(37)-C2)-methylthiotransferase MiaB [Bdellovibrionales bacterium]
MAKTINIQTYGCQMNDYESDRTYRLFHDQYGYSWNEDPTTSDLVLFNTCSIREKADQKAMSTIGSLLKAKERNPKMVIAVGGCMAQMKGKEIQERFPYVDIVFGTHQWTQLPNLVFNVQQTKTPSLEIDLTSWKNYKFLPFDKTEEPYAVRENVTIQNGCNHFCTFCLVPFTRGREVSRPAKDILREIEILADHGVKEVNLLGQNVNAYGSDRTGEMKFSKLLSAVAAISGIERVRFVTSHPNVFDFEMIDVIADTKELCNDIHLPIQSGSDRILDLMEREYHIDQYRRLHDYMRKRIPNLSLRTDIIVGFPGETEEDFQQTLNAVKEFDFDQSYSFMYSPRPNTKAAKWKEQFIEKEVAGERLIRLQSLQQEIHDRHSKAYLDQAVEVLVDGTPKKQGEGWLSGKTQTHRTVNFEGPKAWMGTLQNVVITDTYPNSMRAVVAP